MNRRQLLAALGAMPLAAQTIPRPSPDFELTFMDGRKTRLSQYKGKVVAFACILTT